MFVIRLLSLLFENIFLQTNEEHVVLEKELVKKNRTPLTQGVVNNP
jgi:hypothetical protein